MAVPYQFANTPFGTPLQLTQLDADFTYLTGTPTIDGLNITNNLSVGGTSKFTGQAQFNNINRSEEHTSELQSH